MVIVVVVDRGKRRRVFKVDEPLLVVGQEVGSQPWVVGEVNTAGTGSA